MKQRELAGFQWIGIWLAIGAGVGVATDNIPIGAALATIQRRRQQA